MRRRRRSRWSAAAIRRGRRWCSSPARRKRVTLLARKPLAATHVALSGRADRQPRQCRGRDRRRDLRARGRGRQLEAIAGATSPRAPRRAATIRQLFSFIGAEPNTDWLAASGLKLDPRGFVCTGADAGEEPAAARDQPPRRVRGRRRALGIGQAGRRLGRRRRPGGGGAPRLSRRAGTAGRREVQTA